MHECSEFAKQTSHPSRNLVDSLLLVVIIPKQYASWSSWASAPSWKLRSVFNFLLHFWLWNQKSYWKSYVLRLEVSCGDSGLWFGLAKIKNLLIYMSFKSDDFWEIFEKTNGKNKANPLKRVKIECMHVVSGGKQTSHSPRN